MEQKIRYRDGELKEFDLIFDQKTKKALEELKYYLKQIQELAEGGETKLKNQGDVIRKREQFHMPLKV